MKKYKNNNRVTIYDIAKKVGVSPSTVNRAINGKACVNEETKKFILETAKSMGYKANKVAMGLTRKRIKIGFMVNNKIPDFQNMVLEGAKKACNDLSDYNVEGKFYMIQRENCRQNIIDKINELVDIGVDGIVFSPPSDLGFEDTLKDLKEKNIPVATVNTDVSDCERLFSIRPDGKTAGKIAADILWLSGLRENSEVAIFTGCKQTKIHREYVDGFMEAIKENHLKLVSIIENQDDPQIAYYSAEVFLKEFPNIQGIYINTANSVAVCKKIVEMEYAHKVKIVTTDLFPGLIKYIENRIVSATIFHDPYKQGNLAFKYMYDYIAEKKEIENDILISPKIILRSNVSKYI